jgi:hypothetical protein
MREEGAHASQGAGVLHARQELETAAREHGRWGRSWNNGGRTENVLDFLRRMANRFLGGSHFFANGPMCAATHIGTHGTVAASA